MAAKRFFWLKLQEDFFQQKAMKKLRRMDRGETLTIIYLKMQLASLRNGGVIAFEGFGDSFAEELSLQLDEQEDDVRVTVEFLTRCGLMEQVDGADTYILPGAIENTGSEGDSAARVRAFRERKTLQSDGKALQSDTALQCNDRKELEKRKEEGDVADKPPTRSRFVPPDVDEVRAYCLERRNGIDPASFVDYYQARGWMLGKGQPMKDWRAAVRTWEKRRDRQEGGRADELPDL